ncbi:L-fuculose-phosphate aldolase [Ereboglobus sp. PH5-10]|uniref:class II aldolase/adducin family protein n=1 Tax=Ereboglobus sp. PH5-10 TaxID=2940629 RepID=UPI002405A13E|nr:class II aldolase/adducin family protein [Ereboglobus sp. PH5-10]MDF9827417.1 L-fuculose-phosphate aldolase [Ereboglobus sp. PH5-10]
MAQFLTARDVEKLIRNGQPVPADARLTPGAHDYLRDHGHSKIAPVGASLATPSAASAPVAGIPGKKYDPVVPDYEYKWTPGADPKTPAEIAAFFNSPAIVAIKHRMVDIGQRMWARNYTDGNGGNLTVRVGDNLVLCTPTLISKGFMKMEDICLVDMDAKQLAGARKRTSECMTHIAIMKRQPLCKSCCHAHPPHATAFAVAKVQPPTCLIPEADIFLGKIAIARYETPGSQQMADTVGEVGKDNQCVLLANHGVITWGKDIEDAYWKMENADAYCQTVWIASQLGGELGSGVGGANAREFIKIRKALGMPDNREGLKECELCDNSEFRPGVMCQVPDAAPAEPGANPEVEALVQRLTGEIMKQLGAK